MTDDPSGSGRRPPAMTGNLTKMSRPPGSMRLDDHILPASKVAVSGEASYPGLCQDMPPLVDERHNDYLLDEQAIRLLE